MTDREPVVIVGAGPVGLACAVLLARRGIASVVIERHEQPYELPRGVHLDDEVFRVLQAVGIDEEFAPLSRPMPGMRLVDGRGRTMAEFTRDTADGPNGFPPDSMFDQPDLERVLLRAAESSDLVELRRGCAVLGVSVGRHPEVRYQDAESTPHTVTASAVIGCDGANSTVRECLGIPMRDLDFDEQWLVVDVRTPEPMDVWGGVHQICDPARAATFMHVTGTRYRWEFRVHEGEDAEALSSPASVRELLRPWLTDDRLAAAEILRRATYTFRARVADTWRHDRVFLAGDAAHQTPPFVGQGLGSGLRDALNLTWKLAEVLTDAAPESVLDTYEHERKPHALGVIRMAMLVGWALTGGTDRFATVRRHLVAIGCRVPGIGRAVPAGTPPLRAGHLIARRGVRSRLNGRLFPQPWVSTESGVRRFDDLLGPDHALVTRGPLDADTAARFADAGVRHVDADALRCVPSAAPTPGEVLRRHHTHAVLLRPDRVVMASARSSAAIADLLAAHHRAHRTELTGVPR